MNTSKPKPTPGSEPAFPHEYKVYHSASGKLVEQLTSGGLTKREYFAGITMQAMLLSDHLDDRSKTYAQQAVEFADALIAELVKGDK